MLPESKMLIIDLTTQTYQIDTLPEKILINYLGGRGLGVNLLYQSIGPGVGPLSPENPLIFTVGFAQGMDTPFSPKVVLTTKSPLTNLYLYSVSSGAFGHSIRKAGYMAIMIKGKAEAPVYLNIGDDKVEFRDARHLWGMKTLAAQNAMLKEAGNPKASTAAIGPGGEKLIKYAAIMNDGKTFRAFGRGGTGCVMGSKKLKGIVISGNHVIQPEDLEGFKEVKQKVRQKLKENRSWVELRRDYGTGEDMPVMNQLGFLPTRNWKTGVFEAEKLMGITNASSKLPERLWGA